MSLTSYRYSRRRMATLGARLREAREAVGLSQSALARQIGVASQTINQWESNKKAPSRKHLIAFVQITSADIAYLLYGQRLREQNVTSTIPSVGTRGRFVALVNVKAAVAREITASSEAQHFAHFPCGPSAVAFTLPDTSQEPTYAAGTVWVIDYDLDPRPGDMVLGRHGADLAPITGQYRVETSAKGRVEVIEPLNKSWPAARSDLGLIEVIAVMTEFAAASRRQ